MTTERRHGGTAERNDADRLPSVPYGDLVDAEGSTHCTR